MHPLITAMLVFCSQTWGNGYQHTCANEAGYKTFGKLRDLMIKDETGKAAQPSFCVPGKSASIYRSGLDLLNACKDSSAPMKSPIVCALGGTPDPKCLPKMCKMYESRMQGLIEKTQGQIGNFRNEGKDIKNSQADSACGELAQEFIALNAQIKEMQETNCGSDRPNQARSNAAKPACEIPDADGDCPGAPKTPKAPSAPQNKTWDLRPSSSQNTDAKSK